MSKIRTSLAAVLFSSVFTPLALAQEAPSVRTYGIGVGLDATRTWSSEGSRSDQLDAQGSFLFLNRNFHFGPAMGFQRRYTAEAQMTGWSIGALSKWTYEDLQTADRTPFVTLAGFVRNTDVPHLVLSDMQVAAGIGYEMFLSPKVSLAQSINGQKTWYKQDYESMANNHGEVVYNNATAGLRLDLNIYL